MREYMMLRSNYKKLEPQFITAKTTRSVVVGKRGAQMIVDAHAGEHQAFKSDINKALCV